MNICSRSFAASILVVGVVGASALYAAGGLDPSFGNGGIVITSFGAGQSAARALATDSRGRLIAAGSVSHYAQSNADVAVARYRPDGALDPTFGDGGRVILELGSDNDGALGVDVAPGGRIAVGGYTHPAYPALGIDCAVVVLTRDGELDVSFGTGGVLTTDFADDHAWFDYVKFLPDGRLLAAGRRIDIVTDENTLLVARYNRDGSLDRSFADGGWLMADQPLIRVAVAAGGEIVAMGSAGPNGEAIVLARYTRDGLPDAGFGSNGRTTVVMPAYSFFGAMALAPDGSVVLGGGLSNGVDAFDVAVVRLTRTGTLDRNFGTGGIAKALMSHGVYLSMTALAVSPDGSVTGGGLTYAPPYAPYTPGFGVIRFNRRGHLDEAFGTNGSTVTLIGSRAEPHAIAMQPGGRVVLAGFMDLPDTWEQDFALARYSGR
jgi:uncharacterized delta-60 repeat protein